jgi:hypothetical protein
MGPEAVVIPPRPEGGEPKYPLNSLIETYARWREQQEARAANDPFAKARDTSANELEADAWHRSRKRVAKRLARGKSPTAALVAGFRRYHKLGGRMSLAAWHKKMLA